MSGKPWLNKKFRHHDAATQQEHLAAGYRQILREHGPEKFWTATDADAKAAHERISAQRQAEQAAHPSTPFAHHPPGEKT